MENNKKKKIATATKNTNVRKLASVKNLVSAMKKNVLAQKNQTLMMKENF